MAWLVMRTFRSGFGKIVRQAAIFLETGIQRKLHTGYDLSSLYIVRHLTTTLGL